jgi:uncharacterized protein YjbJ (UPF0337 family)
MNKDLLETQWVQAKEFLRDKWSRLTEEDLRQINGRFDILSDKLQQRYGYTSAQAEEEIRKWNIERTPRASSSSSYNSDRSYNTEKSYTRQDEKMTRRDDGSSALKWLLALALPLLLLALYLGSTRTAENTTYTPATAEEIVVFTDTPADQNVGQAIRQALFSNSTLFNDLRNLRISSSNGIVTASGTVANAQERDRVISILNNISGVRQVNNQIEIRQP